MMCFMDEITILLLIITIYYLCTIIVITIL